MTTTISDRAVEMVNEESYFHIAGPQAFEDFSNMVLMGWAENSLMLDVVRTKMNESQFNVWQDNYALQGNSENGDPGLMMEFTRFLPKYFKAIAANEVTTSKMVVLNGISSFLESLSHILAAEDEYFMTPTPWYYSAVFDMGEPFKVNLLEIPLTFAKEPGDTMPFELTVAKIEKTYNAAKRQGKKVRGIVLFNPQNPLGIMYSKKLVEDILAWAATKGLHVVSDEIYGRCWFNNEQFESSVLACKQPDPDKVHFLYSFSKDFGMIGIRCGVVVTSNTEVLGALKRRSRKYRIPFIVQDRMRKMIADQDWIDNTFDPALRTRLKSNYDFALSKLKAMGAIILPSTAGLYIWASFKNRFKPANEAGEKALFQRFMKHRVMLVPGSAASSQDPGFFRILISLDSALLDKGLTRMKEVLDALPPSFSFDELERAVNVPYQGLNPDPTPTP